MRTHRWRSEGIRGQLPRAHIGGGELTNRHTEVTERPTHAGGYTAGVGNYNYVCNIPQ